MKLYGLPRLSLDHEDCMFLMRLTAEMLALPHMVCVNRVCRRWHRCGFNIESTGEPACLLCLLEGDRPVFDELFREVLCVADALSWHAPPPDPDKRALREAAIEIVRAARRSRPHIARFHDAWLTRYRAAASKENHAGSVGGPA